jgi:hypothetical protein
MKEARMNFVGMSGSPYRNSSHKFFALGPSTTAEVLTDSGWQIIGPPLPKAVSFSCLITIDESTIFLIGNYFNFSQYFKFYQKMADFVENNLKDFIRMHFIESHFYKKKFYSGVIDFLCL